MSRHPYNLIAHHELLQRPRHRRFAVPHVVDEVRPAQRGDNNGYRPLDRRLFVQTLRVRAARRAEHRQSQRIGHLRCACREQRQLRRAVGQDRRVHVEDRDHAADHDRRPLADELAQDHPGEGLCQVLHQHAGQGGRGRAARNVARRVHDRDAMLGAVHQLLHRLLGMAQGRARLAVVDHERLARDRLRRPLHGDAHLVNLLQSAQAERPRHDRLCRLADHRVELVNVRLLWLMVVHVAERHHVVDVRKRVAHARRQRRVVLHERPALTGPGINGVAAGRPRAEVGPVRLDANGRRSVLRVERETRGHGVQRLLDHAGRKLHCAFAADHAARLLQDRSRLGLIDLGAKALQQLVRGQHNSLDLIVG